MPAPDAPWKSWQKFSFRFFFLFLGLTSCICWEAVTYIMHDAFYHTPLDPSELYKPLIGTLHWLDKNLFHIGYKPATQLSYPGDNHFGAVFYCTAFLISMIAATVWSFVDRKRSNYNRVSYWFKLYLRYAMGIVMFSYGIDKLIPVQMPHPNAMLMLTPFGNFDLFTVLWNSMGIAPGYMIFTGGVEVLGALLLFSRRTAIAGYFLTVAVLMNVVALNFFYNVSVKLFASQLLLTTLYLLAPYIKNIFRFFFYNDAKPFIQPHYVFYTGWKKYVLIAALIVVPLTIIGINTSEIVYRYGNNKTKYTQQKAYDVTTFIANDTLPPLTTDTLRWKRFLLFYYWHADRAVILNMKDEPDWYRYDIDTIKKTFTLYERPGDKKAGKVFHYVNLSKDRLQLSGNWKGHDIQVWLKVYPIDSLYLNKEKIEIMRD